MEVAGLEDDDEEESERGGGCVSEGELIVDARNGANDGE